MIQDNRDVGILGDLVLLGSGRVVDCQGSLFDFFLLCQVLEFLIESFVVIEENDEAAHFGVFVLYGLGVDLLDQTGQGVADFAREDHRDRVGAIGSDQALLVAGKLPCHVEWVKRAGHSVPNLWT